VTTSTPSEGSAPKPLPALFDHCSNVYAAMVERSVVKYPEEGEEGTPYRVYEGFTTQLFRQLRLSVPYYTSVMKELQRMGCVLQLRRGGNNAASHWLLQQEPTPELFRAGKERAQRRSRPTKEAIVEQRIRDICRRLDDLERKANA
jgi:hypothetical protein